MPEKPQRPCGHFGCRELTRDGYCPAHERERFVSDGCRGNSAERGYGSKWRKAREIFLKRNPVCVQCGRNGRIVPASVVDHVIPHRGDQEIFWDKNNWQALCKPCHDKKTARGQ